MTERRMSGQRVLCDGYHRWWGRILGHRFDTGACVRCGRSAAYVNGYRDAYLRRRVDA